VGLSADFSLLLPSAEFRLLLMPSVFKTDMKRTNEKGISDLNFLLSSVGDLSFLISTYNQPGW
jgi:hypothetical protein